MLASAASRSRWRSRSSPSRPRRRIRTSQCKDGRCTCARRTACSRSARSRTPRRRSAAPIAAQDEAAEPGHHRDHAAGDVTAGRGFPDPARVLRPARRAAETVEAVRGGHRSVGLDDALARRSPVRARVDRRAQRQGRPGAPDRAARLRPPLHAGCRPVRVRLGRRRDDRAQLAHPARGLPPGPGRLHAHLRARRRRAFVVITGVDSNRVKTATPGAPKLRTIARVRVSPYDLELAGTRIVFRASSSPRRPAGWCCCDRTGAGRALTPSMPSGRFGLSFDGHTLAFVSGECIYAGPVPATTPTEPPPGC